MNDLYVCLCFPENVSLKKKLTLFYAIMYIIIQTYTSHNSISFFFKSIPRKKGKFK